MKVINRIGLWGLLVTMFVMLVVNYSGEASKDSLYYMWLIVSIGSGILLVPDWEW